MNVVEDVTTVEKKEEIKRIGKLVDEMGLAGANVPKKVIKKIGKLVPDENAESNKKTASGTKVQDSGERAAINEEFKERLDRWDKKTIGFSFVVGETSTALQEAGIPKRQIRWDASKIATLLNKHQGMSIEVIKQIPQLLESPVIVVDSKKGPNAKIVMGDLYDANNKIVTAVLLLTPTSNKGNVLQLIKISSAEGRGHIKSLFTYDDGTAVPVRYVDKKRIQSWLNVNRLQLPLHNLDSDSKTIIPQKTQNSNSSGKNSSKDFDSGERNALPDAKKTDKTIAKSEEKLAKKEIRLKAEYETDTVFSESGVKKRLATIDGYKALPASERGDIESRIWTELNESNGYDAREWLRLKWSVRLIDELVSQRGEAISRAERDIISKQVNQAIDGIVDSGRKSVRGRMEGEIRAELSDKIRNEATAKERIRSEIYQTLKKIDDKKTARKNVPLILSVFH